jgi:hypothetical protein
MITASTLTGSCVRAVGKDVARSIVPRKCQVKVQACTNTRTTSTRQSAARQLQWLVACFRLKLTFDTGSAVKHVSSTNCHQLVEARKVSWNHVASWDLSATTYHQPATAAA